ncbi:hypothetical protein DFS34DRAFT_9486 [Phlyctochytrium arcticum]|nr:hypothetical protein DFS34DRAFT_9486 [Phlyctochytrium arcticum]
MKFDRAARNGFASDNIGQEELYEALEKVLNDLKNYSGHSFPFLKPVSKREAPDYFDVIRHPMDLGTMTKKLSNCEYHSKQAFADDCYLIWSNCMQYNTIPADNVYRRHATAMRRKTTDLLKKVPDIVIAKAQADDDESEDDEESGSKHANQANGSVPPEFERPRAVQRSASVMSEIHERTATPFLDEPDLQIRGDPTPNVEVIDVMDTAPSEEFASAQFALQHSSLQEKRWRDVTLPYRHEYCNQRTSQLKRPFGERKAIVPTREMLGSSVDDEREYVRRNKRRRHSYSQVRNPSDRRDSAMGLSDDEELEIALEESHFPELKFPAGCVPELPQPTVRSGGGDVVDSTVLFTEEVGDLMESMPSMSDFPQIDPLDKGRLHNQISRNIRELRKVKEIHSKILAGEAGHQDESSWGSLIPPYQPKRRHPSALPPLSINRESAAEVAKQSVAKLLMHTGFDVASESALSTLSETFIEYFLNIGKSLRTYMNKYSRTMSSEDLLLHALQENGVENINQVDMYIRQDVERYGDKLYDLRRKMAYAYKDMIRVCQTMGETFKKISRLKIICRGRMGKWRRMRTWIWMMQQMIS